MTREPATPQDRRIIAGCAAGALIVAVANPFVWRWVLDLGSPQAIDLAQWTGTVLATVPPCLALVAVVLTLRPPVAFVIAAVSGVVTVVVDLQRLGDVASVLGVGDYLRWIVWALVLACALLAADGIAWRQGAFTAGSGAIAGAAVAVLAAVAKLAMNHVGPDGFLWNALPATYWLTVYVMPSLMLVAAGAVAGSVSERRVATQDTAGVV